MDLKHLRTRMNHNSRPEQGYDQRGGRVSHKGVKKCPGIEIHSPGDENPFKILTEWQLEEEEGPL